jgi:hypothetical protein
MTRWVYCPKKGTWVAFSYCMMTCPHLKETGGLYRDNKILCGYDNSVRHIMDSKGGKPKEFRGKPRIYKRSRTVKEA